MEYLFNNLFIVIPGFLSLVFLLVGGALCVYYKRLKKQCIQKCDAVAIDVVRSKMKSDDPGDLGGWSYFPIYEYRVNGKTYKKQSAFGNLKSRVHIGQTTTLYVNPENPEQAFQLKESFIAIIFILVGIILAAATWLLASIPGILQ